MPPLTSRFPIFTVLVNELTVFLRPLTCTFLNFTVFVNELTTYERPGALIDVVHGTLCHPCTSLQASQGLHSAFQRA